MENQTRSSKFKCFIKTLIKNKCFRHVFITNKSQAIFKWMSHKLNRPVKNFIKSLNHSMFKIFHERGLHL